MEVRPLCATCPLTSMATLAPASSAANAARTPAPPPPIMRTSVCTVRYAATDRLLSACPAANPLSATGGASASTETFDFVPRYGMPFPWENRQAGRYQLRRQPSTSFEDTHTRCTDVG